MSRSADGLGSPVGVRAASELRPQSFYARQTPVTDPGAHHDAFAALPAGIAEACTLVQGLVTHSGHAALHGWQLPAERATEAELRGVEAIVDRIVELDARPLAEARPLELRFAGHCRVSTVLACAILRAHGVPVAARAGFSAYHGRGMTTQTWDHWVCEVWSEQAGSWILVDAELEPVLQQAMGTDLDPLDVPRSHFVTASQAWLACRRGYAAPTQFGLDPTDAGMDYVRATLLRDLASLNGWEAAGSDKWGLSGMSAASLSDDDLALLDRVAEAMEGGAADLASHRDLYLSDSRLRPTLA